MGNNLATIIATDNNHTVYIFNSVLLASKKPGDIVRRRGTKTDLTIKYVIKDDGYKHHWKAQWGYVTGDGWHLFLEDEEDDLPF